MDNFPLWGLLNVFQKLGFELMYKVATSTTLQAKHLVHSAQFNVGRAYYQGFGVKRSEDEAERLQFTVFAKRVY